MRAVTHYELLGVPPTATQTQIRDAYRAAARARHPDRAGERSAPEMAAVNEAYRILGDPVRRQRYDAELRGADVGRTTAPAPPGAARRSPAPPPVVHEPARFPWRFMAVLGSLGAAVVLAGVVLDEPAPAVPVDNILRAGDCVTLSAALDAAEVSCDGAHDAVVQVLVPFGRTCPSGTDGYRDRQGMGTACVVRASVPQRP